MESKRKKIDFNEEIKKITADYEEVAREQKERIIALREENHVLAEKLQACEKQKETIAAALIRGEQVRQAIIEAANRKSEKILGEARRNEELAERKIAEHHAELKYLRDKCERILRYMDDEMVKNKSSFTLELVSKKEAFAK